MKSPFNTNKAFIYKSRVTGQWSVYYYIKSEQYWVVNRFYTWQGAIDSLKELK